MIFIFFATSLENLPPPGLNTLGGFYILYMYEPARINYLRQLFSGSTEEEEEHGYKSWREQYRSYKESYVKYIQFDPEKPNLSRYFMS